MKRKNTKLQTFIVMIQSSLKAILLAPLIVVSLLTDLLKLPGTLLQDEKYFEYKYQNSLEYMEQAQTNMVTKVFIKVLYQEYNTFKGVQTTYFKSMSKHRKIMKIIDNMHDLTCRGSKDYKKALENVKDFNLAKILVHKCTIPHPSGDIKKAWYNMDVIYAI